MQILLGVETVQMVKMGKRPVKRKVDRLA